MDLPFYKLKPAIQNYSWGRKGKDSIIAKLIGETQNLNTTFAELWYGSHVKASAEIWKENQYLALTNLSLEEKQKLFGSKNNSLVFLLKILSIAKSLSIQVHPDKTTAEKLHKDSPENYPDPNQKLEIAIALTPVTMLHGFRNKDAVIRNIKSCPELAQLLAKDLLDDTKSCEAEFLKEVFSRIVTSDTKNAKNLQEKFLERINKNKSCTTEEECVKNLCSEFPEGDAGVFLPLIMNLVSIQKNQAVVTKANTPHAYLSGELVECMTNSDNVVRAALTPKFKDVDTLISITSFAPKEPELVSVKSKSDDIEYFDTGCVEFKMFKALASENKKQIDFVSTPAIIITTDSSFIISTEHHSLKIEPGFAAFIPAATSKFVLENVDGDCWIACS
ncbi:MAG: mannose-6-phosphate isomerase, class I [Bdellovibrionales bacterium]|nr:mannose-6-phosphate isomerase, class I [Bdellovibrionales bacterium]